MGSRSGDLLGLLRGAGLHEVRETELTVTRHYASFEQWWHPYTLGVGPAGDHVRSLDDAGVDELRERCRQLQPDAPFDVDAVAWAAVGVR